MLELFLYHVKGRIYYSSCEVSNHIWSLFRNVRKSSNSSLSSLPSRVFLVYRCSLDCITIVINSTTFVVCCVNWSRSTGLWYFRCFAFRENALRMTRSVRIRAVQHFAYTPVVAMENSRSCLAPTHMVWDLCYMYQHKHADTCIHTCMCILFVVYGMLLCIVVRLHLCLFCLTFFICILHMQPY